MLSDDMNHDDGETEVIIAAGGSGRGAGGFVTGMVFIVLAIGLNFLLDSFTPDDVAELPWFIALAFESGGKLGVTVVLCSIGLLFILWEMMVKADAQADPKASFSAAARTGATRLMRAAPAPTPQPAAPPGEEAYAEEIPDGADSGPKKIPAMRGGFQAGRATGGPVGDANPGPSTEGSGAMVLSTAKYLNVRNDGDPAGGGRGGSGASGASGFKRGRTNHTRTEE